MTGTFLSRDTYGGTMDNILSQNRYTYVGNNPVNYADPDGHKAVGTTIKNIFSAAATTTRKAAQEAKNQTGRAAEIAVARSGNGAAAVSMATNRITRNEVNGVKQGTTQGATAVQSAGEKIVAGTEVSQDNQANNYPIKTDTNGFLQAADEMIKTYLAGKIDASPAGPWIGSVASAIEQLECAAYNYCDNAVQSFIEGKDFERIYTGVKTFLKGAAEAFGGASLIVVGGLEISTGAGIPLGAGKMTLGLFGLTTAVADVSQGTQDIEYGWNGDSTTPSSNFFRDSLFFGSEKHYNIVSTLVGAVGLFEGVTKYPMLAGTSATALIPGRGTQGNTGAGQVGRTGSIADTRKLDSMTPAELSKMTPDQLKQALPNGWTYSSSPDGRFIHIRDGNGIFRIRIDPADAVTAYPHIHIFDANGNLLDINGNIVPANSPDGHIPR